MAKQQGRRLAPSSEDAFMNLVGSHNTLAPLRTSTSSASSGLSQPPSRPTPAVPLPAKPRGRKNTRSPSGTPAPTMTAITAAKAAPAEEKKRTTSYYISDLENQHTCPRSLRLEHSPGLNRLSPRPPLPLPLRPAPSPSLSLASKRGKTSVWLKSPNLIPPHCNEAQQAAAKHLPLPPSATRQLPKLQFHLPNTQHCTHPAATPPLKPTHSPLLTPP